MAKTKKYLQSNQPVWRLSAVQATLQAKPRYNAFSCGYGAHGSAKYNRAQEKRRWRKELGF